MSMILAARLAALSPAIHSEPSALGRGKRARSEVDYNAGHEAIEEHLRERQGGSKGGGGE